MVRRALSSCAPNKIYFSIRLLRIINFKKTSLTEVRIVPIGGLSKLAGRFFKIDTILFLNT
jgi:hypothetical protein